MRTAFATSGSMSRALALSIVALMGAADAQLPDLGTNGAVGEGTPFALPTVNNALWYGIFAVAGVTILILLCLCICNCRTKKAPDVNRSATLNRRGTTASTLNRHVSLPAGTLSRPKSRFESLPEQRAQHDVEAIASANEFVQANNGKREFRVIKVHVKQASDEMNLVVNDSVVLSAVYADLWASGVSKRSGGPYFFPLVCLGGSVPRVLINRMEKGKGPMVDTRFSPRPIRDPRQLPAPIPQASSSANPPYNYGAPTGSYPRPPYNSMQQPSSSGQQPYSPGQQYPPYPGMPVYAARPGPSYASGSGPSYSNTSYSNTSYGSPPSMVAPPPPSGVPYGYASYDSFASPAGPSGPGAPAVAQANLARVPTRPTQSIYSDVAPKQ
ncbi:uncharacterized protein EV422DRAFT_524828 [Fimicolochytrium jonesii]|uniref:uncharacterized protein n=1 Tax=Fimicolochytrium jonesii TaxID=1396493 RepID=UPI0022FEF596|nr:uncharacterized protein EV422DRAFT_524828 [Fimicolochytrium jonesii]KAI8822637.1 hypothetical protein EV422DRAFT_524828 [Fimicolochytrium jonesii]